MSTSQKVILELLTKYTQKDLADKLNVSQSYISFLKNGKQKISLDVAERIKKLFDVVVDDFEISNEDFLSHISEPEPKINPTKKDALKALKEIQIKKENSKLKNSNEGELYDGDLVPQRVIDIPIEGFASLKKAFFAPEYIKENFKERIEFVTPEQRVSDLLYRVRVMKNNFSMVPSLYPGEWTYSESISEQHWLTENYFKPDKIYQLWHPVRGILFKRISNHNVTQGTITLSSDNEDKIEYPDEDFLLSEFRKILVVRKKEVIM